jgi:orotate phosphoribosyltransferase
LQPLSDEIAGLASCTKILAFYSFCKKKVRAFMMTCDGLIDSLYRIHAVRFGNFTLKSGRQSMVYIDLRQMISYPDLLRRVAALLWQTLSSREKMAERLCGVPYTALPIATCLSLQHNIPMLLRRKEKKYYGTAKLVEGVFEINQNCLIIEDVITTGSSILETASDLRAAGLLVTDTAILIDREEGGRETLEKAGIHVSSVLTLTEILHTLANSALITESDREKIAIAIHERERT